MKLKNIFKPTYQFKEEEALLKNKYDTLIVAIVISTIGLIYGIIGNIIREIYGAISIELFIIFLNIIFFSILRINRNSFAFISKIMTFQFLFLFLFLYYKYEINELKFLWLYPYPIILLYLQNISSGKYWLGFMLFCILIAPFQPFVETSYSVFQATYIAFVFIVISIIVYIYKLQMLQAREIISKQRQNLEDKYKELSSKDKMLTAQSKQAVMGEMMTMIAHQWRQPLSTVTLNISNIQFKRMLNQDISDEELDKALTEISDTVVYLSDTVDDFQTFFRPNKEKTQTEVHDILQKAVNFIKPRLVQNEIEIQINKYVEIQINTYVNELVQITLNLLNNAIDALMESNQKNKKIIMYVELKDDYIYISVVDNADGIRDADLEQIFHPYFSTKDKNGTGLGLYMSQMLAQKQFDGEITLTTSTLGTHFLVKIKKDV